MILFWDFLRLCDLLRTSDLLGDKVDCSLLWEVRIYNGHIGTQ